MNESKINELINRNRKLENATAKAFAALAKDNTYNENINYAWRILGEVLGVVHSDELAGKIKEALE